MTFLFWILPALAVYAFLLYVVARLVVPFMEFGGFRPAHNIPKEIKDAILELESKSHDKLSYLQAVFDFIMQKNSTQWNHTRFQAAFRFPRAFINNLDEIWNTHDFIYCTSMNYLVAAMLVNSKYFKDEDIGVRHVFVNFFIHQYLKVNVGGKWIDIDPAGSGIRGKPLGTHLVYFG